MNNLKTIILVLLLGFPLFFIAGCGDDDAASASEFDITFAEDSSVDGSKCKAVQDELIKLEIDFGLIKHSTENKCVTKDGESKISVDLDNEKMDRTICNDLDTALVDASGTPRTYWYDTDSKCIQRPDFTESIIYIEYDPSSNTSVVNKYRCFNFLSDLESHNTVTSKPALLGMYIASSPTTLPANKVCVASGKESDDTATADDAKITLTVKSEDGCASVKTVFDAYNEKAALKTKSVELKYEDSKLSCISSE